MVKNQMSARNIALWGLLILTAAFSATAQENDYTAARNTARMAMLESEVQRLTGQLEEANYALSQMRQRLDRLSTDVDFRLTQLEKPSNAHSPAEDPPRPAATASAGGVTALKPPSASVSPAPSSSASPAAVKTALPNGAPRQQYEFAFDLLTKNDYARAESAFKQFIAQHSSDNLAGNAQYWLGETYYVRNNFSEAAAQFLTGYQKYPKNAKAPDNLLKLGLSLANLGRTQDACSAFARFDKEYPQAAANLKRRASEERQRLACR